MGRLSLLCSLVVIATAVNAYAPYKHPYYAPGRSVLVHLFEWKWEDIALECERFLGPRGFGGIQISPPNENVVLWSANRPWWERYQPISYRLITRSGNEQQLADMLRRCNAAGVRIYADAVINHMTMTHPPDYVGTAGSTAVYPEWSYPAVPYNREHFNYPPCIIQQEDYFNDVTRVRNCQLLGLVDLNQGNEHTRNMIVNYMNKLIDYGLAGFRIDCAKQIWPVDLRNIFDRLHNLNTQHGFPANARPFVYQEIIDYGDELITRDEYTPHGLVTEFKAPGELSNAFRGGNQLRWLRNWGPAWGLMANEDSLIFIDNHDNERGHGTGGGLTYKEPRPYKGAIAFMLAYPYGEPQIMSSYDFWDSEAGPPMDNNANIISPSINSDGTCGNGWVCQHRWRQIYAMVGFRNAAGNTGLNNWWDNGSNQIAFCRGGNAFIAFNNDYWDLNENLQTCLPAGVYCDVISGDKDGGRCQGKTVTVGNDGRAQIRVGANDFDMMLAIHVGPESRL